MNTSEPKRDDSTPFPTRDDHPETTEKLDLTKKKQPSQEELLDEGLDETFPASDPVSISTKKTKK
ncbi:MAG TPA: hypothetical protein VL003_03795 [Pusillimonas sp.]|uniref:hypothetical protein n=1 Tax=Pusillimonas sp. TaxID=3040095 RepID=UPI002D043E3B|nr:hypothetical protein [Pusillimonas sp.]HUH87155.1 hypothetical protein [Pusillimonas sp.]